MKRNARSKNRRPQASKAKMTERKTKTEKRNPKRRNHEEK